jgi:hypothetical protein
MNRVSNRRNFALTTFSALLLTTAAGCGPGDAPDGWGLDVHTDMVIASTAAGGGALTIDFDFSEEIALGTPQCIGGDGDTCVGGILLYTSESPGFDALLEDEPDEGVYALVEGVDIRMVLTDRSPEASFFVDGVTLDTIGESVVLGESLDGLHVHGAFQVAVPGGTEQRDFFLAFELATDSPAYSGSQEFVLILHAGDHAEDEIE